MSIGLEFSLVVLLGFVCGAGFMWFVLRSKMTDAYEKGRAELMPELAELKQRLEYRDDEYREVSDRMQQLQKRKEELDTELSESSRNLAVYQEKSERIPVLEEQVKTGQRKMEAIQANLSQLNIDLAHEKEKSARIPELADQLKEKEQQLEELRDRFNRANARLTEFETTIASERKQFEEKQTLLNEARDELKNQFKNLSQEIFDEKGKKFTEQNKTNLDSLLTPLREQIKEFRQKVDDVYVSEGKDRASLRKEIENLRDLNQKINQEAMNLTRALKGDKKAQGNWGEMILERVLEQSGLRKGLEYETQGGFRDSDNRLMKPDVIIHLPEEKDVVIDSKVSLLAYEQYSSAETEAEQIAHLKDHVAAIRNHINILSSKDYSDLKGLRSLDFVLMFLPIEAAFMVAFQYDENLFSHAFQQKIVVVTPTTLLATLRTIENIWRYERQNQNAQAIAERAGAVYDKLRGFVEDMEKLGKQISTAHTTYDEAMNKLTRGKGNLINQACRFVDLGVKVRKKLSRSITDVAEIELREDGPDPEDIPAEATDADQSA